MRKFTKELFPQRKYKLTQGRKQPQHAFLMIHHQLLMVFLYLCLFFPSNSFFLSGFISRPFQWLASCFQITLLPNGRALLFLSSSSVYPLLSSVFCPHGDQRLPFVLPSQALTSPASFISSFLPQLSPPPSSTEKKVDIKLFCTDTWLDLL